MAAANRRSNPVVAIAQHLHPSDLATGEQHDFDGWPPTGYSHYTGEGQREDQQMVRGNRAILSMRGPAGPCMCSRAKGGMRYVDEFTIDEQEPRGTRAAHLRSATDPSGR